MRPRSALHDLVEAGKKNSSSFVLSAYGSVVLVFWLIGQAMVRSLLSLSVMRSPWSYLMDLSLIGPGSGSPESLRCATSQAETEPLTATH